MAVGVQATKASMDSNLTSLAVQASTLFGSLRKLDTQVNSQGDGLAYLTSIGYGPDDAAAALQLIGYLNNLAGVYYGTATVSSPFDFDNALSVLWGGQV